MLTRVCSRLGVPWVAEILCSAFCCLAYLTVSSGSRQVFTYFGEAARKKKRQEADHVADMI